MLAYEEHGKGFPVVLIHAFPLSRKMWDGQADDLKSHYRVILPDMPGLGESARLPGLSIAEMARQTALLLEELKIKERIFIGGLSMGGYIAFEFARQFPERLSALGLFSTRAQADTAGAREKRMQTIAALRKEGMVPFADKTVMNLLGQTSLDSNPGLVEKITKWIRQNKAEGIAEALLALADRRDSAPLLPSIACSSLIIAGEEDKIIPPADAEWMHGEMRDSEFHVLPQAGHLVNLESAGGFNSILGEYLKKIL